MLTGLPKEPVEYLALESSEETSCWISLLGTDQPTGWCPQGLVLPFPLSDTDRPVLLGQQVLANKTS